MRTASRRRAVTAALAVTAAVLMVAAVLVGAPQRAAEAAQEQARQEWLSRDWTPTTAPPAPTITVPAVVPDVPDVPTTTAPEAPAPAAPAPAPVTTLPAPTLPAATSGDVIGTIRVASATIDLTIIEGSENVDDGLPARHTESVTLESDRGNTVLAGHRTGHGGPFRNLDRIQLGGLVTTQDRTGRHQAWEVTSIRVLPETDTGPLLQTGERTLTLYACADANGHPGSTSHRIVITARPQPLIPHPRAGAAAW